MEQEAAPGELRGAQDVHERPDGADAMDGERPLQFDGQGELHPKGGLLRNGVVAFHPTVQTHLADGGLRVREEMLVGVAADGMVTEGHYVGKLSGVAFDAVLLHGSLPLAVLETRIDAWIDQQSKSTKKKG